MSTHKRISNDFSSAEKRAVMTTIFENDRSNSKKYIANVSDYISDNFAKIDGFDFRWTSLITNNPLLLEDMDYMRVRSFIENTVTEDEIQAYKDGKLRDLYATFESLLVCNLKYYDRIMAFCTQHFLRYVRIDEDLISIDAYEKNVPQYISMTPTQIWCAVLGGSESTEWELNYAWSFTGHPIIRYTDTSEGAKSIFEQNFERLYQNKMFKLFVEFSAVRIGTNGYRNTMLQDKTSNRKLSQICSKFTKTSVAISEQQLDGVYNLALHIENNRTRLYESLVHCMSKMYNGDASQFAIYVHINEFYIHCSKFSMRVSKDASGKITKDYLANTYECFLAEQFLVESIRAQIDWAKNVIPAKFNYDKDILKTLLQNMLEEEYRDILCISKMNEYGVLSKISFTGIFNNVRVIEECMFDNRVIKREEKIFSKKNASNYIIDRGYYIFGRAKDVYELDLQELVKSTLVNHYTNYCIPVLQYMFDIIGTYAKAKLDIIAVLTSDVINPARFNNENIKYTSLSKADHKYILKDKLKSKVPKKGYWRIIED